jgi:hypothetical protein
LNFWQIPGPFAVSLLQQSLSCRHSSPIGRQPDKYWHVSTPVLNGSWHVNPQHSVLVLHGSPTIAHSLRVRQWPLSQLKLQQSLLSVHTSPSTRHMVPLAQRIAPPIGRHARLQQSASASQISPPGPQFWLCTQLVPLQSLLQQSLSPEHPSPSDAQIVVEQTPPLQPSEQQSAAVVHAAPIGSHAPTPDAHVKLPLPSSTH